MPAVRKQATTLSWRGAPPLPPAIIGKPYSAPLPAVTGGGNGQVVYTVGKLPSWLYYSIATRTLSGTPPDVVADVRVKASATDSDGSVGHVFTLAVTDPSARFGHIDKETGAWIGRPEETCADAIVPNPARPDDVVVVRRIQSGIIALRQKNAIGDAEVVAANRFVKDHSVGVGVPGRTSDTRLLGVSLGGVKSNDGIANCTLDAASRLRETREAIGPDADDRLVAYVVLGGSMMAAAAILKKAYLERVARGIPARKPPDSRRMGKFLIADLRALGAHYEAIDSAKHKKSWNRGRR